MKSPLKHRFRPVFRGSRKMVSFLGLSLLLLLQNVVAQKGHERVQRSESGCGAATATLANPRDLMLFETRATHEESLDFLVHEISRENLKIPDRADTSLESILTDQIKGLTADEVLAVLSESTPTRKGIVLTLIAWHLSRLQGSLVESYASRGFLQELDRLVTLNNHRERIIAVISIVLQTYRSRFVTPQKERVRVVMENFKLSFHQVAQWSRARLWSLFQTLNEMDPEIISEFPEHLLGSLDPAQILIELQTPKSSRSTQTGISGEPRPEDSGLETTFSVQGDPYRYLVRRSPLRPETLLSLFLMMTVSSKGFTESLKVRSLSTPQRALLEMIQHRAQTFLDDFFSQPYRVRNLIASIDMSYELFDDLKSLWEESRSP